MVVGLDFETYSEADLVKGGVGPYASHGSFEILMTALSLDDGPVLWWRGFPTALMASLARCEGLRWHAYNAPFEMACMGAYGITVPLHRWRCTLAHAYCRGFAGTLAQVGAAVGLSEDKAKLATGKRLINRFCKPAPKNHRIRRYTAENDPENWAQFKAYNIQDVVAEREVRRYLAQWPMTEEELDLWRLDREINRRGVPVDVEMAQGAVELSKHWVGEYDRGVRELTGGVGGRQVAALLKWARDRGYTGEDLRAKTVDNFLGNDDDD